MRSAGHESGCCAPHPLLLACLSHLRHDGAVLILAHSVSFFTLNCPRIALIFGLFSGVEHSATKARSSTRVSFGFSGAAAEVASAADFSLKGVEPA